MYSSILVTCSLLLLTTINVVVLGEELLVITVATEANDGFNRFMKSVDKHGLETKVLGMGLQWEGGDIARFSGGGHKINLLKKAMEDVKDRKDLVVMFVDSYDVILTGSADEIIEAFKRFDTKVVFSAEGFCWPNTNLESKYPQVKPNEKRFLNSGGFIGYAHEVYSIVTQYEVKNEDDDQLYYTNIFLDQHQKGETTIKLDTSSEIFQCLNGALDEVKVKFKGKKSYLYNIKTGTMPIVIHGNGPIKSQFNSFTNYLGDAWTPNAGCQNCAEDVFELTGVPDSDLPEVFIAVHLDHPTPFVEDFFDHLSNLTYPKFKIDIFIYFSTQYHFRDVDRFVTDHGTSYNSVKIVNPDENLESWEGRNAGLNACIQKECKYYFALDGEAQLENRDTLVHLIERNRTVVTPLMIRFGKMWSTFWGALNSEGYYKRSSDYGDIVQRKRFGLWNVPYVSTALLIQGHVLEKLKGGYLEADLDSDMAICKRVRDQGYFMYLDNMEYYGHLVNADDFEPAHLHNDLYEIIENQYTWEKKYIHPDYHKALEKDAVLQEPCTDVYWMPIATPTFCWHLIEEMENFGEWSGGKSNFKDQRIQGGYENVPTVDIHTNQIGWEDEWLYFLKEYIVPLAETLYLGYSSDARATMNFVVKYNPAGQVKLRPHHDSSTYTINMALNRVNVDYEGGGVRFLRYNCSIVDLRQGWLLMHPGRLTHQHEGLTTTNGTRYIMVSFIDP